MITFWLKSLKGSNLGVGRRITRILEKQELEGLDQILMAQDEIQPWAAAEQKIQGTVTAIGFGGGGGGSGKKGARKVNIDIIKSKVIKFMMHY
jgi:hypothetical protein